jgi:hypothetical protein
MRYLVFISLFIISSDSFTKDYKLNEETVIFPGRISKINKTARLIRLKVTFENVKFLTRNSRVELWNESVPDKKCLGYIEGTSSDYILIRLPEYYRCERRVSFTVGSYLHLYSPDLEDNLVVAKELVRILHRKRTALQSRLSRHKKSVDSYIEKVDVVNRRFEILKQKLDLEWQRELGSLEEDKTRSYQNYRQTQARINELEYKIQQYRVRDQNMIEDRWSLDPKLYFKK